MRRSLSLLHATSGTLPLLILMFIFGPADERLFAQATVPPSALVGEYQETRYRFENDGTGQTVQRVQDPIMTQAEADGFGKLCLYSASETSTLRIDFLRVRKNDGRVLDADMTQVYGVVTAASKAGPALGNRKFTCTKVPDLQAGDVVEFQSTETITTPLIPGHFWVIHYDNQDLVVRSEIVSLDVPAARTLALKALNSAKYQVTENGGRRIFRWEVSNSQPRKPEAGPQPPLFSASTLTDWKQVGDWYLGLQSGRIKATPEIAELAAKLTAGKTTAREKLNAIYQYVSESIGYMGISFASGGFEMHAADEVLHRGYGDCKDKQVLLASLLAASGLEAYPALINSERGVIEPEIPMPIQFDHLISAVALAGELVWVDPTIEFSPSRMILPALRGKQTLLMQPWAIRLTVIPAEQ